jgi:hypothetical protein
MLTRWGEANGDYRADARMGVYSVRCRTDESDGLPGIHLNPPAATTQHLDRRISVGDGVTR